MAPDPEHDIPEDDGPSPLGAEGENPFGGGPFGEGPFGPHEEQGEEDPNGPLAPGVTILQRHKVDRLIGQRALVSPSRESYKRLKAQWKREREEAERRRKLKARLEAEQRRKAEALLFAQATERANELTAASAQASLALLFAEQLESIAREAELQRSLNLVDQTFGNIADMSRQADAYAVNLQRARAAQQEEEELLELLMVA